MFALHYALYQLHSIKMWLINKHAHAHTFYNLNINSFNTQSGLFGCSRFCLGFYWISLSFIRCVVLHSNRYGIQLEIGVFGLDLISLSLALIYQRQINALFVNKHSSISNWYQFHTITSIELAHGFYHSHRIIDSQIGREMIPLYELFYRIFFRPNNQKIARSKTLPMLNVSNFKIVWFVYGNRQEMCGSVFCLYVCVRVNGNPKETQKYYLV